MSSATQNGRTSIAGTAGKTVTTVTVNTAPHLTFSLHDCTDPGQTHIYNCFYPYNAVTGGLKFPTTASVNVTVKNGITIHTPTAHSTGNFTVNFV